MKNLAKYSYITIVVIYLMHLIVFFLRFKLSYQLVNVTPEIVKLRDLSYSENLALIEAENIRDVISEIAFFVSIVVFVLSIFIFRCKVIQSKIVLVILFLSLLISLLLFITNGVNFIPHPPVR
jgi:hypothetical protein